jgi:hypothetical protein
MKSYKSIAHRDNFSGHWWIKTVNGLTAELYKFGRCSWELHNLYDANNALFDYVKLDPKQNVAYPTYRQEVVPSFCSLRAAINWIKVIEGVNDYIPI